MISRIGITTSVTEASVCSSSVPAVRKHKRRALCRLDRPKMIERLHTPFRCLKTGEFRTPEDQP